MSVRVWGRRLGCNSCSSSTHPCLGVANDEAFFERAQPPNGSSPHSDSARISTLQNVLVWVLARLREPAHMLNRARYEMPRPRDAQTMSCRVTSYAY
jgi:hypothetical protein